MLTKIKPFHPPIVPPQGAVMKGMTPDGHQLFYEEVPRTMSVPDYDTDSEFHEETCPHCDGTGVFRPTNFPCHRCNGTKVVQVGEEGIFRAK